MQHADADKQAPKADTMERLLDALDENFGGASRLAARPRLDRRGRGCAADQAAGLIGCWADRLPG